MNDDEQSAAAALRLPRGTDTATGMLQTVRARPGNAPSPAFFRLTAGAGDATAEEKTNAGFKLNILSYEPRPLQKELHGDRTRFKVIVAHRRFGKTVFAINELLRAARRTPWPNPRLAYVAPYERQAKAVAWDHLKHYGGAIAGARFHETELRCDLPGTGLGAGARISLYGADNPDALRGLTLDGAVLDEYAQMDPRAWSEVIRPALADRAGWAIFIGTPMGRNSLWSLFERAKRLPGWRAQLFRASETGVLPQAELEAARAAMSEAEYAQEFECSFDAAIRGAYYGALIAAADSEKRIGVAPYEPGLPVDTAWDMGVGDATAIWFCQRVGREVRLIDYHEASGAGLEHYAEALRGKGYNYGEHILPHDAQARELGSGKSRVETLIGLGLRPRVLPPTGIEDGIEAARRLIPRCWFDAAKCARGLEALRHYRAEWDDRMQILKPRPRHDWASHGADGFRYLAMGLREEKGTPPAIAYDDRGVV